MSEKRHATLDAKNTDTYQRNKKLREERDQQRRDEIIKHGSEYFQFNKLTTRVPAPLGLSKLQSYLTFLTNLSWHGLAIKCALFEVLEQG